MPLILPNSFATREEVHSSDEYLWLVQVQLQKAYRVDASTVMPAVMLRAVNYHETIEWPLNAPDVTYWEPFNFELSSMRETSEGDLPTVQLTIDNSARTLMRMLHDGDGLEGNEVQIHLVPRGALALEYPDHEGRTWKMQIASASADDRVVTFKLERANFFTRSAPQDRFSARRCRWVFGGAECGYVQNGFAGYTTCGKTFADCVARGADMQLRGLPKIHPKRFGGFPGIPKQR